MDEVLNSGFNTEKQRAIERMREMNARSKYRPNAHSHYNIKKEENGERKATPESSFLSSLNIPFLSNLGGDSDISLILGLALILMSEGSDKLLVLALIYILL